MDENCKAIQTFIIHKTNGKIQEETRFKFEKKIKKIITVNGIKLILMQHLQYRFVYLKRRAWEEKDMMLSIPMNIAQPCYISPL